LLASRVIAGGMMDSGDGAAWEGPGVKPRGIFCGAVVPKANHVLSHRLSLLIRGRCPRPKYDERMPRKSTADLKRCYGRGPAPSAQHDNVVPPAHRPSGPCIVHAIVLRKRMDVEEVDRKSTRLNSSH